MSLVAPSYRPRAMPVRPTWQPEDPVQYLHFDARWTEFLGQGTLGEWRLQYPVANLTLLVTGADIAGHEFFVGDAPSPPEPVNMLGTQAEAITTAYGHLEFRVWYLTDADGLSVVVSGTDPQVVERFARALRREPWEFPEPFEIALLPEHFLPMRIDEHAMEFTSSVDCCDKSYVAIFLVVPDPAEDDRVGKPVTVNGNPAEVFVRDGDISVHIGLSDGSELKVSGSSTTGLDEAQLLRIAEGVTVTSAAIPFRSP